MMHGGSRVHGWQTLENGIEAEGFRKWRGFEEGLRAAFTADIEDQGLILFLARLLVGGDRKNETPLARFFQSGFQRGAFRADGLGVVEQNRGLKHFDFVFPGDSQIGKADVAVHWI